MRGMLFLTAEGDHLAAFRDALRHTGIRCRHQQMRGGCWNAEIALYDKNRVQTLAEAHDVALTITRETGLRRRLRPYRKRLGLLLGIALGCVFFYRSNAFVRSIEITGNTEISEEEILSALDALGIRYGTKISDIAFSETERSMRLAVSDIEWITMRHTGGRLIVDLTEERDPPPLRSENMASNYIATQTAQITSISVLGGVAVCKRGDAVKAGDLLISGVDTDKRGITRYYRGDGVVKGIYEADFTQEQPFVAELPVRGETVTQTVLTLFGKRLPLSQPPDNAADCIYEEEKNPLVLFGHTLPITLLRCRYTEQITAVAVFSKEEATAVLEEAAARFEHNFHADDTILRRTVSFQQSDLGISLKIHYVFEGVIGKRSEFFVKL